MKLHEAEAFFAAFQVEKARMLVRKMMINNYTEAILEYHPEPRTLLVEEVYHRCSQLCHTLFREIEAIMNVPEQLPALLNRLARNATPQASLWFDAFNRAYDNYKHNGKLQKKTELFAPYLEGETYCDIGCGGGDLVAHIKEHYPQFKTYTGIDVLDWRTDNLKHEINFQMLDFSKPGACSAEQYDMATCIAVLHHVGHTDKSRQIFLKNVQSALSKQGRLLVEEDVILPHKEISTQDDHMMQVGARIREQSHFSEYVTMTREEQKSVLTLIDLLANTLIVGVQDMAFPFGFKSIREWTKLFTESGYALEDVRINGFTRGLFNQSSHVLFILKPKKS